MWLISRAREIFESHSVRMLAEKSNQPNISQNVTTQMSLISAPIYVYKQ